MAEYNITITTGAQGAPGQGVPSGGTTGQFLKKVSATDYDTVWSDSSAVVNSINDVNDVSITAVQNGEILKYNSVSGLWENAADDTGTTAAWGNITGTLSNQTDLQTALDGKSATTHNHNGVYATAVHTHVMADITDSTWISDYTVTQGDVTAHQAALTITESQISDLGSYLTGITGESIKNLSDVFSTMTPTDGQVLTYDTVNGWQAETPSSGVTDHTLLSNIGTNTHAQIDSHIADSTVHFTQASISITESQISDLQAYLTTISGSSIKDLSDVFSSMTPTDGQILTYDTINGWQAENAPVSAVWGNITGTLSNQTDLQSALDGKAASSHTHVMADITDSTWISDITGENLADLSDVPALVANKLLKVNATGDGLIWGDPAGTTVSWGDIAGTLSNQTDLQSALDAKAASSHTHVLADITDAGTMASQNANAVAITGGTAVLSSLQLSGGTGSQGTLSWNVDEETLDLIQDGATLQVGQEVQIHARNVTGSLIANGTPVMATGTVGASGRITVAPMIGSVASNAKYFVGIATEDIANTTDGKVTTFGKVHGVQTNGLNFGETWNDGDVIYVSDSTTGALTNVAPSGLSLPIAFVINAAASNGILMVRATNLDENAYATAAQGALADSATQPGDNVSDLVNDAGYITSVSGGDHTTLTNIGTNTHAQIDTHIADSTVHFTQASISITESQISDLGTYIPTSQKGVANGVATLDAGGKVPTTQLPALALTDVNTVANEAAQLALTAQEGDVAIRTDLNKSYVHNGGVAGTMADWSELLTPTDQVLSVDGRTGAVTLSDLYAPLSHTHSTSDITDLSSYTGLDVRYYTETETDTLLSGKSDTSHNHTLDGLSNVTITGNTSGELLKWDGAAWINNTIAEAGLATSAQGALADSATQPGDNVSTLTNDAGYLTGITSESIGSLSDVDLTGSPAAASGDVLMYNGISWTQATLTEADISDLGTYIPTSEKDAANGVATLDATTRVPRDQLGTGTPDNTKFLRGDGTWSVPSGTGSGIGALTFYTSTGAQDDIDLSANTTMDSITLNSELDMAATADFRVGGALGWRDLFSQMSFGGSSSPTLSAFRDGVRGYLCPSNSSKEWFVNFHIDHDYAGGSNIYPHIHFTVNAATSGVVRLGFEYTVAKGHAQATGSTFSATTTIYKEMTINGGTDQYKHFVAEVADLDAIPSTLIEPDSIIMMRCFTDTGHANYTYNDDIFVLQTDCHYNIGKFATPNKVPDFYA